MFEKITWPAVALVGMVLTSITVMSIFHVDSTVILNAIVILGLGGGLGVLTGIKSNVNGNLAKLTDMVGAAMEKLAASHPAPPPDEKDQL
jgi:hypothetical protein